MSLEIINARIEKTLPGPGNSYMAGEWATSDLGVASNGITKNGERFFPGALELHEVSSGFFRRGIEEARKVNLFLFGDRME